MTDFTEPPLRVPPSNIQAEACVLGSMILSEAAIGAVTDIVSAEDFYRPAHQTIFNAIRGLPAAGKPVDLVSLRDALIAAGQLDAIGGIDYLVALPEGVPSAANAEYYATQVRECSVKRGLIVVADELQQDAFSAATTAEGLLEAAQAALYGLDDRVADKRARGATLGDSAALAMAEAAAIQAAPGEFGLRSGLTLLDDITGGLRPGEVMVLGGATGSGKSTMAYHCAAQVAAAGKAVLIVSGEMGRVPMAKRFLQAWTHVSGRKMRQGGIQQDEWERLEDAARTFATWNVWLEGRSRTIPQIGALARNVGLRFRRAVSLIVIDYLQIMQPHEGKSRLEQVSAMSHAALHMAEDLGCAVISVSQFAREGVKAAPGGKRPLPTMHHLRECGDLENDAHFVLLMHYPEPQPARMCMDGSKEVWLRLAKGRETGDCHWPVEGGVEYPDGIRVGWIPWCTAFKDFAT